MSDAIAKERLTAYQRWELPAFDIVKEELVKVPSVTLPTAEELELIQQQAHEEGLAEGHAQGYAKGYAEGAQKAREEEQAAHDEVTRLAALVESLDKELHRVDQQVAQSLLELSMEIARQVLQQALKVKPELLLAIVNQAIAELPPFNQHAHVVLHPDDAHLVRGKMGVQLEHTGWKIFEDPLMARGGCRVETAHSQIDASLATRWKRVVSSIGQESTWLEP
jgi:flagellar assembly protein FliH